MHFKRFVILYICVLFLGLGFLSFRDLLFIFNAKSQVARVTHMVEAGPKTFYKIGGSYQEQIFRPALSYLAHDKTWSSVADYGCKDGCHKLDSHLTLFYDQQNPQQILINTFEGMWKPKIYFLIIMGVLFVFSLPNLYYPINRRPESELSAQED
jgi:hypothetical protein